MKRDKLAKTGWKSPSNIALVKYWGKKGNQLPANPSISFSLDQAFTQTEIEAEFKGHDKPGLEFLFEGQSNSEFEIKLKKFLSGMEDEFPWLKETYLRIQSSNTFPHSSGIASSASSYSALALCILSLDEQISGIANVNKIQKASEIARRGSGSACRSV